jgi:hypothetical protein
MHDSEPTVLFMPTTPFREGDVCKLFGQVFWLSDQSNPAPSHGDDSCK